MATESSVSKLRVETANGNGRVAGEEEEETIEVKAMTHAVQPTVTALPTTQVEISVLARGDTASGRWVVGGDGEVRGEFSGEIECGGLLLIGKGAEVKATIRANEVTVAGLVRGNITALGRLRITATGRLEGDARVAALVVQEGGVHHGVIRVHPEGVPEDDIIVGDPVPLGEPAAAVATPVDRVRKFWGEFF